MTDKPFTVATLADRWQCSPSVVYNLVKEGRIASFPIGIGAAQFRIPYQEAERVGLFLDTGGAIEDLPQRPRAAPEKKAIPDRGVYFVDCGPYTKIGHTDTTFSIRLDGLKTSNPYDLNLWAGLSGPRSVERQLHREFIAFHYRLEWFKFDNLGHVQLRQRIADLGGCFFSACRHGGMLND